MTVKVEIVLDSIGPGHARLTTVQAKYWRAIHSEFLTHRLFSRNASSSRAIPVEKLIAQVRDDPALPIYWGSNKKGMQAGDELTGNALAAAKSEWELARHNALMSAERLSYFGLHKQLVNRILEPWSYIHVVVTATEWENFFNLRTHQDAQPEIKELADAIKAAMDASTPKKLDWGEWHIPYLLETEKDMPLERKLKYSVARCARVSYVTHGTDKVSRERDQALHDTILASGHMSPFEHQAQANPGQWGNFDEWKQYRKTIKGEAIWHASNR